MVDQRRSQTSAYQPKYDTYAKPVLLSQPEKQRASFHLGSDSPESVDGSNHGARKAAPGKLDLSKIDSLSQGDLSAALAPAVALRPSRGPSQNFGTGADTDNTEKGSLRSPGRQDLPNGTPLSRHPSDALSRKASPKALLDGDGIAQGQITIVAEARLITSSAVAQYEQKILQGQRSRKGRFSGASTPDVSRHASVCSSEHVTPREHPSSGVPCTAAEPHSNGTVPRSSAVPDSSVAETGEPHATAEPHSNRSAPRSRGAPDSLVTDAKEPSAGRPSQDALELPSELAGGGAAAEPCSSTGSGAPDSPATGARDASEQLQAADAVQREQPAERVSQDSHPLPVSTCASPSPAAEPEPQSFLHQRAAAPMDPLGPAAAAPDTLGTASEAPASSRGAAEADRANPRIAGSARAEGSPSDAWTRRNLDSRLSVENAQEPEWVAAFRRVVSLAVNTPLSQSPAARAVASANAGQQSDGVPGPSKLAPSPSSEINDSENSQIGGRSGPFSRSGGGRNLDTAFESTLTDSRRKRLRADSSAHGSGSVVRAAAAVQRAAERATLDRNDYSGARISQEAASVLSPGAIALVNGRTAHSPAELQAQLSDVVHQLRFCLASMSEQQRPLLHAADILQAAKVPRRDLAEAVEKLQEAERLRRWSEIAQSENIARLLGILGEMQAVQQARTEEVHFNAPVWLKLLGSCRSGNDAGRLGHC